MIYKVYYKQITDLSNYKTEIHVIGTEHPSEGDNFKNTYYTEIEATNKTEALIKFLEKVQNLLQGASKIDNPEL